MKIEMFNVQSVNPDNDETAFIITMTAQDKRRWMMQADIKAPDTIIDLMMKDISEAIKAEVTRKFSGLPMERKHQQPKEGGDAN